MFSGAEVLDGAMPRFEWAAGRRLRSMTVYAPLSMGIENIRLQTREMGRIGGMLTLGSFADWVREARSWVA